jgi:hypothetical protein|tara:strand:- start:27 stop:320 length:294 start_codon:yes stop_codon:yes gene_type:complete
MSTKPMKPLKNPNAAQVRVDLKDAETIKCKSCNNYLFITSFILKRLSALVSPNGQEALIPVQVYSCGNCGEVAEGMLEGSGIEKPKEDSLSRPDLMR